MLPAFTVLLQGGGYANDFKAAMDQVDQDYFNEIMTTSGSSTHTVSVKDDGTTKEDIEVGILNVSGCFRQQILPFYQYFLALVLLNPAMFCLRK